MSRSNSALIRRYGQIFFSLEIDFTNAIALRERIEEMAKSDNVNVNFKLNVNICQLQNKFLKK